MCPVLLNCGNSKNEGEDIVQHTSADNRSEGKSVAAPALLESKSLVAQKHHIVIESIFCHQRQFKNQIENIKSLE